MEGEEAGVAGEVDREDGGDFVAPYFVERGSGAAFFENYFGRGSAKLRTVERVRVRVEKVRVRFGLSHERT